MKRQRCSGRVLWLVVAILQILVPTVWSVTDAHAEQVSARTTGSHVEASGAQGCARAHPANCSVCSLIVMAREAGVQVALKVATPSRQRAHHADADRHTRAARVPGEPPQRAPPRLS